MAPNARSFSSTSTSTSTSTSMPPRPNRRDSISSSVIRVASVFGLCVSSYALYVESRLSEEGFTAMCDFNESASCSAVLGSKYGHVLSLIGFVPVDSLWDVPNSALGLIFYICALVHSLFPPTLVLIGATVALAFSAFLAYILGFVLRDFCLICVASYVCNTAIFAGAARMVLRGGGDKKQGRAITIKTD